MDSNQTLSNEELHHIRAIKDFLNTDTWKEYLSPMLLQAVQRELPDPKEPDWENRYINAFALSKAITLIINSLTSLSHKEEFINKTQQFMVGVNAELNDKGEPIKVDHGQPIL